MLPFKEFQKQYALALKLGEKFEMGKFTEADRQKWLTLDEKVRKLALGEYEFNLDNHDCHASPEDGCEVCSNHAERFNLPTDCQ